MLKIRLQRVGRKHEPSFRLVLTDSKNSTKSGRFNEVLGSYDPRKSTESFKAERIKHWLSMGAGLTGTVNNLLIKKGIIRGKKVHVGSDYVVKEAPAPSQESEAPVENAPAPEVAQEAQSEAPVEEPKSDTIEAPAPAEEAPAEKPAE